MNSNDKAESAPERSGKLADEQDGWYAAAQWLRNNYQSYDTIADTCDAMERAAPDAQQADSSSAAPSECVWCEGSGRYRSDEEDANSDVDCEHCAAPSDGVEGDPVLDGILDKMLRYSGSEYGDGEVRKCYEELCEFIDKRSRLAAPSPTRESLSFDDRYKTGVMPWSQRIPANSSLEVISDAMQKEINDLRAALATPRQPEDGGLSAALDADESLPSYARTRDGQRCYSLGYGRGRKKGREDAASTVAPKEPAVQGGVPEGCAWNLGDEESGMWQSSCGEAWAFIDGGPVENYVRYCQGCGKPVSLAAPTGASK